MVTQRQPPRGAIIDASSAILLTRAGLMDACCDALPLCMTFTVLGEVTVPGRPGAARLRRLAGTPSGFTLLADPSGGGPAGPGMEMQRLHRGERDTLCHYFSGVARFVIIDDGRGIQLCRRYAVPHINALLCPRLLAFCGRIGADTAEHFFRRISALGRYSPDVVARAADLSPAALAFFLAGCR